MNKRITALGLTAGLLAGAGAGFLLESSGSAGAAANVAVVGAAVGASASTTATDDTGGADDADRAADRAARLQEVLQPLVDDGTLTQAQADEVVSALQAAGPMGGDHGDRGGKGGPGMRRGANLDEVATLLGITPDEMKTALQGGQTLAELAVANGTTAQDVIDLLVADLTAHLTEEVAAGEHTQTEADAKLADATTRITEAVNNGGPMGGGRGGPGGRQGHDGPATTATVEG